MRASFIVGISAVLLVGCGGDDGVSINTNEDNVCSEIAEVGCHNLYQCCTEGEIEDYLNVSEPRTELQCRDDLRRSCERRSSTLAFSIEQGRVRFDREIMDNCLNALVAPEGTCASVVDTLPWREACMNSAWVGTVAEAGTCLFGHDCAGGGDSFCAPNQKCALKPTQGFPCGAGCASAFYCAGGICQPKQPVNTPCTSSTQCQKDLFCDSAAMPMPICTARLPGGSACTSNSGCSSNQCIPGTCTGTGNSCFRDMDCSSRCADDGSFCTASSQCSSGRCSVGGNFCSVAGDCTAGGGDSCVFPVQCLAGDCVGDPICTAATITVDYCSGALDELPLF